MIGTEFGKVSEIFNILFLLFAFSYFFNKKIESLGHRAEGWTWLQVVIGVFITQVGIGLLDMVLTWNAFFIGMVAYVASGLPMIFGAFARYLEEQERARKAMLE